MNQASRTKQDFGIWIKQSNRQNATERRNEASKHVILLSGTVSSGNASLNSTEDNLVMVEADIA